MVESGEHRMWERMRNQQRRTRVPRRGARTVVTGVKQDERDFQGGGNSQGQ